MLDVLIVNGQVVDGSGNPAKRQPVGIRGGRFVADPDGEAARHVIDAEGLTVAPGFVDVHTHYDAQIMWDGAVTPSNLHGVTTVIGGNCGFTIAPLRQETADYLMRMLAVVEGMPLVSLQEGVDWNWESFGDYLDRLEDRIAVNAGFLVGHSALRLAVMGKSAVGKQASDEQVDTMANLLDTCLKAGGLGFSSTQKSAHLDADGKPVPSCYATREEMLRLAAVLRNYPGSSLEFASEELGNRRDASKDIALMTEMSRRAGCPINWNTIKVTPNDPEFVELQLRAHDTSVGQGGRIVALTNPKINEQRVTFAGLFPFNMLPGWAPTFALDPAKRRRALADPAVRAELRRAEKATLTTSQKRYIRWADYTVGEGHSAEAAAMEGRLISDLAREAGKDPFDCMLDIAVGDDLRTIFLTPELDNTEEGWRLRSRVWRDPRAVVGASDAGAHADIMCGAVYSTSLLQWVRERGLVSLEEAVRLLSDAPARLYGLKERGRIAPGWCADVVIFDPDTVKPEPARERDDLPGGGRRVYAGASGIEHVLVNGVQTVRHGKANGATPGTVLRSGRHTEDARTLPW